MSARNELLKLKANFFNGLAIAAAAAGFVLPLIGSYTNDELWNSTVFPKLSPIAYKALFSMAGGCWCAFVLHILAQSYVRQIDD